MGIVGFSENQQKILRYLVKEKEGLTIEQFSKLLHISRSAIHQHMMVLERDGYVRKSVSMQTKGRPGATFVLTDKGIHIFPKNYSLFAEMLINLIKHKLGSEELIEYLHELGASLSESKKAALKNKSLNEQIEMTVTIMQELGYEAQIAKSDTGDVPMIDAYNCIFHDLAYKNQEVCELDLSLLSSLLNSDIEQVCCMAKGDGRCRFKVLPCDKTKKDD